MTEIPVTCPHCREEARAPADAAGQTVDCPACGKSFTIPSPASTRPPPVQTRAKTVPPQAPRQLPPSTEKQEVIVTDIRIHFGSMVVLIITWAIAAIPAMIILALLGFLASAIFMGGCVALLSNAK